MYEKYVTLRDKRNVTDYRVINRYWNYEVYFF